MLKYSYLNMALKVMLLKLFTGYIDVISICNIVNNSISNGFGDNS